MMGKLFLAIVFSLVSGDDGLLLWQVGQAR